MHLKPRGGKSLSSREKKQPTRHCRQLWKLDETEDSQVLIPPSPDVEEGVEQSEGENEDQGCISECQVEESPENS